MNNERQLKWDRRFLEMAKLVASFSKDPSTRVGAVIVDKDNRIVSLGFNGFARGVDDNQEWLDDREIKYLVVLHGEMNSILFADRDKLVGATLYTYPFSPCSNCSSVIIQVGIKRCVAPKTPDEILKRWEKSLALAKKQFDMAGVELVLL